jgi:hypothetical protein
MKLIEYRGECMSGYVPERLKNRLGCSERLYPFLILEIQVQ